MGMCPSRPVHAIGGHLHPTQRLPLVGSGRRPLPVFGQSIARQAPLRALRTRPGSAQLPARPAGHVDQLQPDVGMRCERFDRFRIGLGVALPARTQSRSSVWRVSVLRRSLRRPELAGWRVANLPHHSADYTALGTPESRSPLASIVSAPAADRASSDCCRAKP